MGMSTPYSKQAPNLLSVPNITFYNGTQVTAALDLGEAVLPVGISTNNGTLTPTTFAFQVSLDGSTWRWLWDETGAEVTVAAKGGGSYVGFGAKAQYFRGWRYVKVVGGTNTTPVTQAAGFDIGLQFVTIPT